MQETLPIVVVDVVHVYAASRKLAPLAIPHVPDTRSLYCFVGSVFAKVNDHGPVKF